jgi:hypothetical protein
MAGRWNEWWLSGDAWPYLLGGASFLLLILALFWRKEEKRNEKFKKVVEAFTALAKLVLMGGLAVGIVIFLITPARLFQGWVYVPPSTSTTPNAAPRVPIVTTPAAPQSRTITIPIGTLQTPSSNWSEEVRVVPGWDFRWDVVGQGGRIGVLVDNTQTETSEPGRRLNLHPTQSLRFVSLENRSMQISVAYYR